MVGKGGGRDLLGDLYLPTVATESRPAIVVVHGGGWRKGRPESVRGFGELLSQAGFACLLASYRPSMEAPWPAQIEDVKCAIRFLRANAASLGVDSGRIGIVGDSSGGHLALMAAVSSPFEGSGGTRRVLQCRRRSRLDVWADEAPFRGGTPELRRADG